MDEADEHALEDAVEAYLALSRQGSATRVEDFVQGYPEALRAELKEMLEAVALLDSAGASLRCQYPSQVDWPKALGEFTLLKKLGQGGMGTVFEARQESLNRLVAIKILAPALAMELKQRQKFQNESRVIARLHHTHIVEVYGAGYDHGFCFYVMELIHGHGLSLAEAGGDAQRVARLGLQAAEALAYAHSQKVLHRDIKPGNLLLDEAGEVHLSDFGLATWLPEDGVEAMATQTQEGTLRYMAPETLARGTYDYATDLYSLGVTLYELRTERAAVADTVPGRVVHAICEVGLPPLRATSDLDIIINKCIAYAPQDRYASVAELADDLQRFLGNEPIHARKLSLLSRINLWRKRKPALARAVAIATGAGVLFVLAVVLGLIVTTTALIGEARYRALTATYAAQAEDTLDRIYATATADGEVDPSGASAELLRELLPYYTEAAARRNWPAERLSETRQTLGKLALQTGNYPLAEEMFASIASDDKTCQASCANARALAMARQNKLQEARSLWQQVATQYATAEEVGPRLEAVEALRSLALETPGQRPRARFSRVRLLRREASESLKQAAQILVPILQAQPDLERALYLAAAIMIDEPSLHDVFAPVVPTQDPFDLLETLIDRSPANCFGLRCELLRAALRLDLTDRERNDARVETALTYAESLLTQHAGDTALMNDTLRLYTHVIDAALKAKDTTAAYRILSRSIGILKMIAVQPDATAAVKSSVLTYLARQYLLSARLPDETQSLAFAAQAILKTYQGDNRAAIEEAFARTPSAETASMLQSAGSSNRRRQLMMPWERGATAEPPHNSEFGIRNSELKQPLRTLRNAGGDHDAGFEEQGAKRNERPMNERPRRGKKQER